jgi:hypothetical protein
LEETDATETETRTPFASGGVSLASEVEITQMADRRENAETWARTWAKFIQPAIFH